MMWFVICHSFCLGVCADHGRGALLRRRTGGEGGARPSGAGPRGTWQRLRCACQVSTSPSTVPDRSAASEATDRPRQTPPHRPEEKDNGSRPFHPKSTAKRWRRKSCRCSKRPPGRAPNSSAELHSLPRATRRCLTPLQTDGARTRPPCGTNMRVGTVRNLHRDDGEIFLVNTAFQFCFISHMLNKLRRYIYIPKVESEGVPIFWRSVYL